MKRRLFNTFPHALTLCLIAIIIQIGAYTPYAHEFYLSIYRIDVRPDSGTVEITAKIFTDDVEQIIIQGNIPQPNIGYPSEAPGCDSVLAQYFEKHLKFVLDEEPRSLNFLGKEIEQDVTYLYLEFAIDNEPTELLMTNSVLVNIFDGQTNITHLYHNDRQKSLIFREGNVEQAVKF